MANDHWNLVRTDFSLEKNKHYEGAYCQGNGYLSVRASMEEGLAGEEQGELYERKFKSVTTEVQRCAITKWGTFSPLVTGVHPDLNEVIVNLPYFLDFKIAVDGQPLDLRQCETSHCTMTLNLQTGTLLRELVWNCKNGMQLSARYERFASMHNRHLFVQRISLKVLAGKGRLKVCSGIDANVTTNGYCHFTQKNFQVDDTIHLACKTDLGTEFTQHCFLQCPDLKTTTVQEDGYAYYTGEKELCQNDTLTFLKKTLVFTQRDSDVADVQGFTPQIRGADYDSLHAEHCAVWHNTWESCDVQIDAKDDAQLAVRFSLYHLLRCKDEQESKVSICAKGFAGEAYYGRYFWDTEIYLLPFFLYTNPQAAKKLLLYRYKTLDGARKNAQRYHCRGARFPWQSASTGEEQCSLWEYGDNEVHVTADVVYGLWHYYKATGDEQFLKEYGAEILVETARFWVDRMDILPDGRYGLLGVMGPDEYTAFNRNNTFTNRLVQFNLTLAADYAQQLQQTDATSYAALCKKINFTPQECDIFRKTAENLVIPADETQQRIPQSEDFETLAELDIDQLWLDKRAPFGKFVTQDKLYRSKVLKQADSLALAMLLKHDFTLQQIRNTYEYYEPLTTHDSSLSPINHAIVAGWLGNFQHVERFWQYAAGLDFDPNRSGAEDGIHIANCGCIWQFILRTVAGIELAVDKDDPTSTMHYLPDGWRSVHFPLCWQGKQYQVTVDANGTNILETVK